MRCLLSPVCESPTHSSHHVRQTGVLRHDHDSTVTERAETADFSAAGRRRPFSIEQGQSRALEAAADGSAVVVEMLASLECPSGPWP